MDSPTSSAKRLSAQPFKDAISSPPFRFLVGPKPKEFFVHADIVARQSPYLADLVERAIAGTEQGCATLQDVDEDAFARFVEWAYTENYTVPAPVIILAANNVGTTGENKTVEHDNSAKNGTGIRNGSKTPRVHFPAAEPSSEPKKAVFGFGKPAPEPVPKAPNPTPSLFGKPTHESAFVVTNSSSSIFGKPTPEPVSEAPNPTPSLFGKPVPEAVLKAPNPTPSLFGKPTPEHVAQAPNPTSSLFGKPVPEAVLKAPNPTPSLFGKPAPEHVAQAPNPTPSLFGKPVPEAVLKAPNPTPSLFGKPVPEAVLKAPNPTPSLFGKPAPEHVAQAPNPTPSLFGKPTQESAFRMTNSSSSIFGTPAPQSSSKAPNTSGGGFGARRSSVKEEPAIKLDQRSTAPQDSPRHLQADFRATGRVSVAGVWDPGFFHRACEDFTQVFLCHARLYVFADTYGIERLQKTTIQRLRLTLSRFLLPDERLGDAVQLIKYAYQNTRADKDAPDPLRNLIQEYVNAFINRIGRHAEFKVLMTEDGAFAKDVLAMMLDKLDKAYPE